jgi:hypothetical protein
MLCTTTPPLLTASTQTSAADDATDVETRENHASRPTMAQHSQVLQDLPRMPPRSNGGNRTRRLAIGLPSTPKANLHLTDLDKSIPTNVSWHTAAVLLSPEIPRSAVAVTGTKIGLPSRPNMFKRPTSQVMPHAAKISRSNCRASSPAAENAAEDDSTGQTETGSVQDETWKREIFDLYLQLPAHVRDLPKSFGADAGEVMSKTSPADPKRWAEAMSDAQGIAKQDRRRRSGFTKFGHGSRSEHNSPRAGSISGAGHTPKYTNVNSMLPQYAGEEIGGLHGPARVKYMTLDEKAASKVTVKNGLLVDGRGQLLNTNVRVPGVAAGKGRAVYVMDPQGDLYVSGPNAKIQGNFQHSCFVSGGPVAAAGEIEVKDGVIRFVSPKSGHYKPTPQQFQQFLDHLEGEGVEFDGTIDRTFK